MVRAQLTGQPYDADHISNAHYFELPGRDNLPWTKHGDTVVDYLVRFVSRDIKARANDASDL